MKIHDIISESADMNEAPAGWLKQKARGLGAKLGSAKAATTLSVGDEANALKKELAAWMAGGGIKKGQLTLADLENYLNLKGYGGLAKAELTQLRKGARDAEAAKAAKSAARSAKMQAVGYRAGQMAGAAGSAIQGAASKVAGAAGAAGISEAPALANAPLSNQEIDKVLMAVVQKAYRTGADFEKGKFGKKTPAPAPAANPAQGAGQPIDLNTVDPKDVKLITALKARGYNITK